MYKLISRLAIVWLLGLTCMTVAAQDMQRGLRNYQDILAGRKKLEQLSPAERQEVLTIFRRLQSSREKIGGSTECKNARRQAGEAADELVGYALRLQMCAEARDYTDDCDTEFRRVRDAHDDYESAVSDVESYCN